MAADEARGADFIWKVMKLKHLSDTLGVFFPAAQLQSLSLHTSWFKLLLLFQFVQGELECWQSEKLVSPYQCWTLVSTACRDALDMYMYVIYIYIYML